MSVKKIVESIAKYPGTVTPTVYDGVILDVLDMVVKALGFSVVLTDTHLRLVNSDLDDVVEPINLEES